MKVPEPRRLSNGDWYIYLRLNGKGIPVQDSNKARCISKATSIKAQYKAGELDIKPRKSKDTTPTLGAVLEAYIAKYKAVLSPSTIRGYKTIRDTRFQDVIDDPIDRVEDWQEIVNKESSNCSPKTLKNAWGFVARAWKTQLETTPPTVKLPQVPVKEIPWLEPDEIKKFCKAMEGKNGEVAALLELHGLRASEVGGLNWTDIDLEGGVIRVRGAKVRGVEGWVVKETNKNKSSTRNVPIMIPRLKELLSATKEKAGAVNTVTQSCVYKNIHRACEEAGVTVVGNHGLRHSFCSLAASCGLSLPEIQELGGWQDIQTMRKIYLRVSQKDRFKAANKITCFFTGNTV